MSNIDALRALHLVAAMQADHVSDLWRMIRAGVQDLTERGEASQAHIARALGVSRQRVGQLAAEPVDAGAVAAWDELKSKLPNLDEHSPGYW